MAHEISIQNIGGVRIVEAMYANKPAWHDLGQVFDLGGDTGPDGATARRLSHMEWRVEKKPVYNDDGSIVPGWFTTRRSDTGFNLGMVQGRFVVHQNEEGFDFVDSLVQDGIMRYESAFALHGGCETVLLARFPEVDTIAEGDHSLRYIAWLNSHDGSSKIVGMPTSTRIVCANTKAVALRKDGQHAMRISHTKTMNEKLETARQYLSQWNAGFTLFRDHAQVLASRAVTKEAAIEYLRQLFPQPVKDGKPLESGRGYTMWEKEVAAVMQAWRAPAQNLPSIQGTWWSLFNAVTAATDHTGTYKGTPRDRSENRFLSLIQGAGQQFKDSAFDLACEMGGVALNNAA